MPLPPALQRLVDNELAHLPVLLEQVRRQTAIALRHAAEPTLSPADRMLRFDLAKALDVHGQRFGEDFIAALAVRLRGDDLLGASPATPAPLPRGLALVDETVHSADIEIARCAAVISGTAEWELRELQTFTSALAGLPYVSVASNPLRPEVFAQALWHAADSLQQAKASPVLLRTMAGPLADTLRLAFAAACSRLEAEGVQPSLYRTAVPSRPESTSVLADLLDSVPGRHDPTAGTGTAVEAADAASADLLKSLFDAIAQSSQMYPALRALTELIRQAALELARRDASLLDNARHPLWHLLDRFAFQTASHPNPTDPQLLAWVGYAAEVVARLRTTPLHDAALYASSLDQLDAYSAAQFNAQLQQAAGDIDALQRDAPTSAPLDVASMDTVPASLLTVEAAVDADSLALAWLEQQVPAGWYRMFLRGRWTVLRLLWHSDARTRWLFAGPYPERNDAFDRAALLRLRAESLLRPLVERAVVVRAAESVRRRLSDPRKAG